MVCLLEVDEEMRGGIISSGGGRGGSGGWCWYCGGGRGLYVCMYMCEFVCELGSRGVKCVDELEGRHRQP